MGGTSGGQSGGNGDGSSTGIGSGDGGGASNGGSTTNGSTSPNLLVVPDGPGENGVNNYQDYQDFKSLVFSHLNANQQAWVSDNVINNNVFVNLFWQNLYSDHFNSPESTLAVAKYIMLCQQTNNNSFLINNYTMVVDFMYQNPNVSISQLQNWFVDGDDMSNSLQQEMLEDWNNPNIVKPTKKFKANAKLNAIFNKIKTAANFKQYLQNFEPTFSVAHLAFDVGYIAPINGFQADAVTKSPENYWIKIIYNEDRVNNRPKVVIASTFMHEIIHAEMYRKLLTLSNNNGAINFSLLNEMLTNNNYSGMFDYYTRFVSGDTDWQHEAMGAHYVGIMVNFLQQVYGTQYSDLEYKTIIWMSSLHGTRAWNLLPISTRNLYTNTWNSNYTLWDL